MKFNYCSIDISHGNLLLNARQGNLESQLEIKEFKNSENFIIIFLDFLKKNKITINEIKFFMINLGPASFVGLRNIFSSIKSIALVKKIKILGFNSFQILGSLVDGKKFTKIALENNKKFYVKFLKDTDNFYSKFEVAKYSELDIKNTVVFAQDLLNYNDNSKKLSRYNCKDLEYIFNKKIYINKKLFPIYENKSKQI
jgi:tRNA A37 threonylcarbamoyladenosine modification protein TsaB